MLEIELDDIVFGVKYKPGYETSLFYSSGDYSDDLTIVYLIRENKKIKAKDMDEEDLLELEETYKDILLDEARANYEDQTISEEDEEDDEGLTTVDERDLFEDLDQNE